MFCEETMMYICKMPKQPSPIPHLPPVISGCEKASGSFSFGLKWQNSVNLCEKLF